LDLVPVVFHVQFCRFRSVMCSVVRVPVGCVSVMRGGFVVAAFVVPGGLTMMSSRVFVVFGCFMMMFCRFFGHLSSLRFGPGWQRVDCARAGY
jgi:hypothetical protein